MDQKSAFTEIYLGIGLHDSELHSCLYTQKEAKLRVKIQAYGGHVVKILFTDVIGFMDISSSEFTTFGCNNGNNSFLAEVLTLRYIEVPNDHPYKLFQFLDIDDQPSLSIVAADYTFTVRKEGLAF